MPTSVVAALVSAGIGAAVQGFTWALFTKLFVANLVLGALSKALQPKQKNTSVVRELQDRTVLVRSAVSPHRVIFGEAPSSGTLVYAEVTGDSKEYLHMVIVLAGHECAGIPTVYIQETPLGDLDSAGEVTSGIYAGWVRVKKHLGTPTQLADADLVAESAGIWTADHRLQGCCYIYVRLKFDPNGHIFPNGIPNIYALIRGNNQIYDPRTATTGWSDNWALCLNHYLSSTLVGLGCTTGEVNQALLIAAANSCDELVSLEPNGLTISDVDIDQNTIQFIGDPATVGSGDMANFTTTGTAPGGMTPGSTYYLTRANFPRFKLSTSLANYRAGIYVDLTSAGTGVHTFTHAAQIRYTTNGTFTLDQAPDTIISNMHTAAVGDIVFSSGVWDIYAGVYTVPTQTIDANSLRGPIRLRARPSRKDLFNAVRGVYSEPWKGWQPTDFPFVTNSTYEAQDGSQIFRDIELPYTTDQVRAQRLAKIYLEKSRQGMVAEIPCKLLPGTFKLKPGSSVYITISQLGWTSKVFRVLDWKLSETAGIDLIVQEDSSTCFDWNYGQATRVDPAPDTVLPKVGDVRAPTTLTLASGSSNQVAQADGLVVCAIRVGWIKAADALVKGYEVHYKKESDPSYQSILVGRDVDFALVAPVTPSTVYNVRVRALAGYGITSEWLGPSSITPFVVTSTYSGTINGIPAANINVWSAVSGAGKPVDNATKNIIFLQSTMPSSPALGDTWVNTSTALPTLDLRLDLDSLDSRVTFSRTSIGTYFDINGVMKTAAAGVPRFDHDPLTRKNLGLLIEFPRKNVIFNSATTASGATVSTGTARAPDGSVAYKVVPNAGAVTFPIRGDITGQAHSLATTVGQTTDYVFTGYFAATGPLNYKPFLVFMATAAGGTDALYALVFFDCATGSFIGKQLGTGWSELSVPASVLMPCGMWRVTWRLRFTQQALQRVSIGHNFQIGDENNVTASYTADGVSGVQYACMQFEIGNEASSYVPTTTAAVTRQADTAIVSGANFSSWYNQAQGTFLVQGDANISTQLFGVGDPLASFAAAETMYVTNTATNNLVMAVIDGGVGQFSATSIVKGAVPASFTFAYAANDAAAFNSGVAGPTDSAVTLPTPTQLVLGGTFGLWSAGTAGSGAIGRALSRFTYFPTRLPNLEAQAISTGVLPGYTAQYSGTAWVVVSTDPKTAAYLTAQAALTSTWTGVSGTGKPDDNATLGAIAGLNLKDSASTVIGDLQFLNKYSNSAQLAGDLTGNPFFTKVDPVYDRPAGIKAAYGSNTPTVTKYADAGRTIFALTSDTDATIGCCWPAFRVQTNMRYRVFLRWKYLDDGGPAAAGIYFRFVTKRAEIAQGMTHIGWTVGEAGVDFSGALPHAAGGSTCKVISDTNGITVGAVYENRPVTAVDTWYETVLEFTPNAADVWASFTALNYTSTLSHLQFDSCFIYAVTTAADGATVGAPAGTLVNGVEVVTITTAVSNFNASNDRKATAVAAPTIVTDGSAIDHVVRDDGSIDVSFEWVWGGSEGDIDGFIIYVYQSVASAAYTFGTLPSSETAYNVPAVKRAFFLFGVASNTYYTFGVQAYRKVDPDINAAGIIFSTLVQPSLGAENPYRPTASVQFNGDIIGTINGVPAATVIADLSAVEAAVSDMATDNVLTPVEKSEAILTYSTILSDQTALDTQALFWGMTTQKADYDDAISALTTYLGTLTTPVAWNSFAGNTTIVGTTFRQKFSDVFVAKVALQTAIQNLGVRPGTIFHMSVPPVSGYLPADGAAVSRTTYANLFAAIGTQYGAGDGSTTFNVPLLTAVSMSEVSSGTIPSGAGKFNQFLVTLADGRALVAGGHTSGAGLSALCYIVSADSAGVVTWTATNSLPTSMGGACGCLLPDGRVYTAFGSGGDAATLRGYFGTVSGDSISWVAPSAAVHSTGMYRATMVARPDGRYMITMPRYTATMPRHFTISGTTFTLDPTDTNPTQVASPLRYFGIFGVIPGNDTYYLTLGGVLSNFTMANNKVYSSYAKDIPGGRWTVGYELEHPVRHSSAIFALRGDPNPLILLLGGSTNALTDSQYETSGDGLAPALVGSGTFGGISWTPIPGNFKFSSLQVCRLGEFIFALGGDREEGEAVVPGVWALYRVSQPYVKY